MRNFNRPALAAFVIVVGNITVGGTGKTPFVIWLANRCKMIGLRVGIVARGYKRQNERELVEIEPHSLAAKVGDEALLLALHSACPVIVAANRRQAAQRLIEKYQVDVVLSDDGLQHYNLPRDIEIVIVDGERSFGNTRCLPAGPLREPATRLHECDIIISNKKSSAYEYYFEYMHDKAVSLCANAIQKPLAEFKDSTAHAVAGIGTPGRFFKMLRNAGIHIIEHEFPDHHAFSEADLACMHDHPILMTEKDAVKCKKFADQEIWYIPITLLPSKTLDKCIAVLIKGIPHG